MPFRPRTSPARATMLSMKPRHALAIAAGMLALLAAAAFVAILVAGLASIHVTASDGFGYSKDVNCESVLRPADTAGIESDCASRLASRAGWVKPGLWASGIAAGLLGSAARLAVTTGSEATVSRYGRNRTSIGG